MVIIMKKFICFLLIFCFTIWTLYLVIAGIESFFFILSENKRIKENCKIIFGVDSCKICNYDGKLIALPELK